MEIVGKFKIEKIVHNKNIDVCIGTIDGKNAVYINPGPSITADDLQKIFESSEISTDDENLTFECVKFPKLIFPAEDIHIRKFLGRFYYKVESYGEYLSRSDYLETSWVDNVIDKKAEPFHFENDDYVIINDYKWDGRDIGKLYLLLIFKDKRLRSIRDIEDYSVVERAIADAKSYCKSKFNISDECLCLYFHYRPSYFRMHMHIVCVSKNDSLLGFVLRDVLASEVVKNLKMDPEYYRKDMYIIEN